MLLVEENAIRDLRKAPRLSHVGVIIPTCNASRFWDELTANLDKQGLRKDQILIVDSASTDGTAQLAHAAGYRVVEIARSDFNHGGTRKAACCCMPSAEFLVFLTQDAIPADGTALATLCDTFEDPTVGAAYGRQIPRPEATGIERHARLFNYPGRSELRTLDHRRTLGLKAAFLSNSFAAYRRTSLETVGGFPEDVILAEDSVVAARMLAAGWRVAYVAEAAVFHSHAFTLAQEFGRYFDTGVHHAREAWLLQQFGGAGNEGRRFVLSEMRYLLKTARRELTPAMLRTALKWIAYQLGRREKHIPVTFKRKLSSSPNFWKA